MEQKRNQGHPQMRQDDNIKKVAGFNTTQKARDRDIWADLEEIYVQHWIN